jgi:hypothetical protein
VLELFKMILVSEKPEAIGATAVLKESSPPYNVDALHAAIQQLEQQLAVVKGLTGQIKPATKKKPTRASSAMDRATAALVAKPHS